MDIKKVIDFEIDFPSQFADVVERPYGKLFYNLDNTISHDSNHGVITDLSCDLDQALSDIESFYHEKGLSPRIYPAFVLGEEETLKPFLVKHGFTLVTSKQRSKNLKSLMPRTIIFLMH